MLWEVEILPKASLPREREEPELARVRQEYDLLTHSDQGSKLVSCASHGYLLEGDFPREQAEQIRTELLADPIAGDSRLGEVNEHFSEVRDESRIVTVLPKPGVMDPAAQSVVEAARGLGVQIDSVRTFRRYYLEPDHLASPKLELLLHRVLANDTIEQVVRGPLTLAHLTPGTPYQFRLVVIPLRHLDDSALDDLSRQGQLSLNLAEMRAIQTHYRTLGREPVDVELETLAQTWSEHCSHKTLKGPIDFNGRRIDNLLKETIFGATQEIRRRLGSNDWCVSVFEDNAGVVRFDESFHVCFKVETHNHPSAIEPYGGANTGLGGVIRDPMGTCLGARPICNTDVFCFAPPDLPPESLPAGVLHPKKVMQGVVAGVRDYGNRIGIPTVNGAVLFDERYLGNPLVYCGTVGLIPVDRCRKAPQAGDHIVVIGGRTGRDGIHGATFSSVELTSASESASGGAVQIGNAISEKKMLDVLLQARDLGLYHAVTDCGAGGLSSAIGEMGEKLGAVVQLDKVPLKYQGLSYTEIWISESQERMVLAVPTNNWQRLQALCADENVEAAVIGRFEATGVLRLEYLGEKVGELDMRFLHHGRPQMVRQAIWRAESRQRPVLGVLTQLRSPSSRQINFTDDLLKILSSYNVCSKEWIVRQYDHEVQGGTVIKPLVGVRDDGPGDAAVIMPLRPGASQSWAGLAIGCGINPRYGDLDPYHMAAAAIDEAVRNVVAVGADPSRIALLDNFCWGNTDRPEVLGSLVRAAEACRDVALAYGTPFISGKDSLNNEFHAGDRHLVIPPTLLISALGRVPDVRRCVTMDLKEPGNLLFLIGTTRNEMGGSHYHVIHQIEGGDPPQVDLQVAPRIFQRLHAAIERGLVRACHDLSEGGLAVALAEMAFAGGVGADVTGLHSPDVPDDVSLFSESTTRFVVEVRPEHAQAFRDCVGTDVPLRPIGATVKEPRLRIAGGNGEWIVWASLADLKEAWQRPLRW